MSTQRDRFFRVIGNAYKNGRKDLVIITADMGAKELNQYKNDPNFLINIGPSEQLAATMAAGLALQGRKPYIYGIDPFITLRALEQIRVSICSMNLPVTIVGIGAGLSYDTAGVTHHGTETLNIMRCLPNMTIGNVSTLEMAEYYAKFSLECKTPLYIRLDKLSHSYSNKYLERLVSALGHVPGYRHRKWVWDKKAIVTTGTITNYLVDNTEPGIGVIEIYQFPYNEQDLYYDLYGMDIISVEEGYKIGGIGDSLPFPNVKKIGLAGFCDTRPREEYWKLLLNEVKKCLKS